MRYILEFDSARDKIRSVFGDDDPGISFRVSVLDVLDQIAERTGGAPPYGLDDGFHLRTVRVDPGIRSQPEYRGQGVRIEPRMGTDRTVVVKGDLLVHKTVPRVFAPVAQFFSGKSDSGVCAVAEGFVVRLAATAETDHRPSGQIKGLAVGVDDGELAFDPEGSVVAYRNLRISHLNEV